eukprot:Sspe_Gene.21835::Locus_8215_Transcript_1_1_Confidence_1.000_Length_1765::g.21835::m.21835
MPPKRKKTKDEEEAERLRDEELRQAAEEGARAAAELQRQIDEEERQLRELRETELRWVQHRREAAELSVWWRVQVDVAEDPSSPACFTPSKVQGRLEMKVNAINNVAVEVGPVRTVGISFCVVDEHGLPLFDEEGLDGMSGENLPELLQQLVEYVVLGKKNIRGELVGGRLRIDMRSLSPVQHRLISRKIKAAIMPDRRKSHGEALPPHPNPARMADVVYHVECDISGTRWGWLHLLPLFDADAKPPPAPPHTLCASAVSLMVYEVVAAGVTAVLLAVVAKVARRKAPKQKGDDLMLKSKESKEDKASRWDSHVKDMRRLCSVLEDVYPGGTQSQEARELIRRLAATTADAPTNLAPSLLVSDRVIKRIVFPTEPVPANCIPLELLSPDEVDHLFLSPDNPGPLLVCSAQTHVDTGRVRDAARVESFNFACQGWRKLCPSSAHLTFVLVRVSSAPRADVTRALLSRLPSSLGLSLLGDSVVLLSKGRDRCF